MIDHKLCVVSNVRHLGYNCRLIDYLANKRYRCLQIISALRGLSSLNKLCVKLLQES